MRPISFSVVVPTYGRPERLAECVRSLCALDYDPSRFEIVIVEDGSDRFEDAEAAIAPVATASNCGSSARSTRVRPRRATAARGSPERVSRVHRRRLPPRSRLLARSRERFSDSPAASREGGPTTRWPATSTPRHPSRSCSFLETYYRRRGAPFFASNNLALPRDLFALERGFDERFPLAAGGRPGLLRSLQPHGHALVHVPEAVVTHHHALSLRPVLAPAVQLRSWSLLLPEAPRRARRGRPHAVRAAALLLRPPHAPLKSRTERRRLRLCLLMIVSQAAHTAGFLVERTSRPAELPEPRGRRPPGPFREAARTVQERDWRGETGRFSMMVFDPSKVTMIG